MNTKGVEKRYPQTILATACIPWKEDYSFDEPVFRDLVKKLRANNLKHIYLFGTAGEGYAISDGQFEEIVQVFAEEMDGPELHPIAGLISLSVKEMKERIDIAYKYGIREFMIALPAWGSLSWPELIYFFDEICTPHPDCRFIHYNNPRSKRIIEAKEYMILSERYPNLVAVKYSTTDITKIQDIMDERCPLQYFITELGFGYGNMIGEAGLLTSISSINMKKAWEYFNASIKGDSQTVLQYQRDIHGLIKALINAVGTDRIDGAYDKTFCKFLVPEYPLRLLPPYIGASESQYAEFFQCIKRQYSDWIE